MIADHDPGDEQDDRERMPCMMCGYVVVFEQVTSRDLSIWTINGGGQLRPTHIATCQRCHATMLIFPPGTMPLKPTDEFSIGRSVDYDDQRLS
jgi:hypothetical protein